MTLTFGSLFAGIGGIDLGFERAGMECRWQVEIDPFCNQVLAKRWPDVPRYGDIKELDGSELERVDVIAGGFPCQPVSLAGKGKGQADSRWLWDDFARIVDVADPPYVVVENVPGLAQRGLNLVLGTLADFGFDAEWTCISAASVGAPHLRDRLVIVARSRYLVELRKQSLADTDTVGCDGWSGHLWETGRGELEDRSKQDVANATFFTEREQTAEANAESVSWYARQVLGSGGQPGLAQDWATEPDVGRVAHGVPSRVDRLKALGNAVVPQVAELIGRRLVEVAG